MISPSLRSARSHSQTPTRKSFTSAPERPTSAATSVRVTVSTVHSTAARTGITSGKPRGRSARSSCIPMTRIRSSQPCSAARSARAPIGASTAARTAATAGSACCSSTTTPAPPMSPSTRTTRISCLPACGRRVASPGSWKAVARAAASICHATAVIHGRSSRVTDCRKVSGARSASGSRQAIRTASMR